ncbi:FG-GAP-like repeat-containing protein [Roseibacillus persicicus]|uniref:Peptidase S11 D-alanyl-D-alanine carboxypeptidase A N-terminal domain-containing protein n=1 Tax=Roseibacillus persicicus TaxID=454148 RepID=A0A918TFU7_9BACT|nr:FG-GAP-like repeat-containing protein [Roseibacillus persicicus]GHC45806.1 hypothetical protein GCM10007100_09060 [Roseibacillus persicicus]
MNPLAPGVAAALLVAPPCLLANPLDRDGDGFSDIWQSQFQAPTLNPTGDPDGDGYPNAEEETAGTDPFDASSYPNIRAFIYDQSSSEVAFEVDTLKGKQYGIIGTEDLSSAGPWDTVLPFTTAENNATTLFPPGPIPVPYPNLGFFRLQIQDIDEDGDGLTAYEECLIGTSDQTPNSSPDPRGNDCETAEDWLETNTPGVHPQGAQDNLSALSLAHLQSDTIGQTSYSLMVTATGSDSWHQLTSWNLSGSNNFTEMRSTPPIAGKQPEVHALPHTHAQTGQPLFLTTNIRPDGGLWLSLRSIGLNGEFTHHHTVGYGPQLGLTVFRYAVSTRLIYDAAQNPIVQVVTPVAASSSSIDSANSTWRVLVWHIDLANRSLTGTDDSGMLDGRVTLRRDGLPSSLTATHLGLGSFVFNYPSTTVGPTPSDYHLVHGYGRVDQAGRFTYERSTLFQRSLEGDDQSRAFLTGSRLATTSLDWNGYLNARYAEVNTAPPGREENLEEKLVLTVYEKRSFYGGEPEAQNITNQLGDLSPDFHGVHPPVPTLTNSVVDQGETNDLFGSVMAAGDFNGDGTKDFAVGIPSRAVSRDNSSYANAGQVAVYFSGGAEPFSWEEPDQTFDQETESLPGVAEENDQFGNALAGGDFNGDGYDDLAIGVSGEENFAGANSQNSGVIQILYGSPFGLVHPGNQVISQESLGQSSATDDFFGYTLASGDLNGDGYADLAIGCPYRDVDGVVNAGVVYRAWGTENGLNTSANSLIHQGLSSYPEALGAHDLFGHSLAVGDFNGGSPDDLAIGVPFEDAGSLADTGGVQIVYGENSYTGDPGPFLTQSGYSTGGDIPGAREAGDRFGWALAAGDFTGDGRADLAIGVPNEAVGSITNAGAVNIVYGSPSGLGTGNALLIGEDTANPVGPDLPGEAESGDRFGYALAAGDIDDDGYANLVIGIPYEGASAGENKGALLVVDGSSSGILTTTPGTYRLDETTDDSSILLGSALLLADLDGDGKEDILAGAPSLDLDEDTANSGSIRIYSNAGSFKLQHTRREEVRALLLDIDKEASTGTGRLYSENLNAGLPHVHIASCTKVMTLLLAVDAINEGLVDLDDPVEFSERAGTTGGSKLDYWIFDSASESHSEPYPSEWDTIRFLKDDEGETIPFFLPGDEFSLEMLLHAMMMESCNRASVAIAEFISQARFGHPNGFIDLMDDRGDGLGMASTVWGHPAGGCVTNADEMILMMLEGWKDPLFRRIMGAETFGFGSQLPHLTGTDDNGLTKSNNPFQKITTIGLYPGREIWKGGNGYLWWNSGDHPEGRYRPRVSRCTSSALGIVSRLGVPLAIALQQTGSRPGDCLRLFSYGFQKTFTPDWRGEAEWPTTSGGVTGTQANPVLTSSVPLSDSRMVTAIIDDSRSLKLVHWNIDANSGTLSANGATEKQFSLLGAPATLPDSPIELLDIPSTRARKDLLSLELIDGHIELKLWRIAEN